MSYEFGSFKFLLRFEVDCVESEEDNIVDNQRNDENSTKFDNSNLSFIRSGEFQPNEKNIELYTKSAKNGASEKRFDIPVSKWNQLFFSQTDYLVIGWHSCGKLEKIEKLTFPKVTSRCRPSSDSIKKSTNKLHSLLQKLTSFLKEKNDVYSLVFFKEDDEQSLKIYNCAEHSGSLRREFAETLELVF